MKNLVLASVLAIATAGAAQAQDMFAFMTQSQEANDVIVINPLNASEDGFVAIYDHTNGSVGELLGVARIRQGGNAQTRVQLGTIVRQDVIAYLFAGNDFTDPSKAIDQVEIEIDR